MTEICPDCGEQMASQETDEPSELFRCPDCKIRRRYVIGGSS